MNAPYSCSRVTSPELYNLISGKDKNLFFAPCLANQPPVYWYWMRKFLSSGM